MNEITTKQDFTVRHFFVVNPVCFESRQKMEAVIARVHHFFNQPDHSLQRGSADYAVHVSRFPRDAIGAIRRFANAVPAGAPLRVYAVGGDGILFDCLNGVIGLPNVELGIMPYGKRNDFYRVFGEKNRDVFNSLESQVCAPSVPVDAVYCGSNYVLSYCLIGIEPITSISIKKIRERTFMKRFTPNFSPVGYINYMCTIGAMNFGLIKQYYRLWVDDENLSGVHFLINIMNSPWHWGNQYFSDADPTDGYLDVQASGDMGILKMFRVANKVVRAQKEFKLGDTYLTGYYEKYPHLMTYRRAKKISVASEGSLILSLDGELFYDKYIMVEIKPAAVRIINPNLVAGARL